MMQPGQYAEESNGEESIRSMFFWVFLFFSRGMMSELHERLVACWQFELSWSKDFEQVGELQVCLQVCSTSLVRMCNFRWS